MRPHFALFVVLLVAAVLAGGCQPAGEVQSYHIDRIVTDRTIAAVIVDRSTAWYIKLTGPRNKVANYEDDFRRVVTSFRCNETTAPTYDVPEGWDRTEDRNGLRHDTLSRLDGSLLMEVTITKLQVPPTSWDEYLLSNVNRWRTELKLSDIQLSELSDAIETVERSAAVPGSDPLSAATLVDLVGSRNFVRRRPAFAPPPPEMPPAQPGTPTGSAEISFSSPESWQQGQVGGLRKAAYFVEEGDQRVDITIIDLSVQAELLLPNVNRWRGQVELGKIDQQTMEESIEQIPLGDARGWYVNLQSPANASQQQAILGVLATRGDKSWFVKLHGDKQLALREENSFKNFVASIQFTR